MTLFPLRNCKPPQYHYTQRLTHKNKFSGFPHFCPMSVASVPFHSVLPNMVFALSLLLGFNFLSQAPKLIIISFPSLCGIHFGFPQVFAPWTFCVLSCLFCLFYSSSKHNGAFSTRLISQQCLWLKQPWPILKRKLERLVRLRKTLSWEHRMTFLILRVYFQSHPYSPIRLCLFSLYICKSSLFISTSPKWNSLYTADF